MSQQTITVQANATQAVTASGKYLNIISATAQFKVEMDNGGQSVAVAGSQLANPDGFKRLVFKETQGAANTIVFDASDIPSPGRSSVVQANVATIVGPNSVLADMGSGGVGPQDFPGVDSSGRHRKSITVTNTGRVSEGGAASTDVVAVAVGNNWYVFVWPQTSQTVETDADITVAAVTANFGGFTTHLMVAVLEIYYSKPLQNDQ